MESLAGCLFWEARRCEDSSVITTFLVNHASAVRVLFWLALALLSVFGWLGHRFQARRALVALSVISLAGVLALTMTPSGDGGNGTFCTVQLSIPFQGIDTLANVALLFPSTLFLAVLMKRPARVVLAASAFSAVLELIQSLLPNLGRACDTNDWFMNTVGAVLAALVAAVIVFVDRRRRRFRGSAGGHVTAVSLR
nr:VanZ family protein [Frondihabitans sp. VKM Ac-2883]